MSKAVMQMALDALEKSNAAYRGYGEYLSYIDVDATAKAIAALKAELAKPEPELTVVAWMHPVHTSMIETHKFHSDCVPLYRKEDI